MANPPVGVCKYRKYRCVIFTEFIAHELRKSRGLLTEGGLSCEFSTLFMRGARARLFYFFDGPIGSRPQQPQIAHLGAPGQENSSGKFLAAHGRHMAVLNLGDSIWTGAASTPQGQIGGRSLARAHSLQSPVAVAL